MRPSSDRPRRGLRAGVLAGCLAFAALVAPAVSVAEAAPAARPAAQAAPAAAGLTVRSWRIVAADGSDVVLRGINHPHVWFQDRTAAFGDIKAAGANAIRVVLADGDYWSRVSVAEVRRVVGLCAQHRLICVLEPHDTTGNTDQSGPGSLSRAVDWWISVKDALVGQESRVVVNIGNEPFGSIDSRPWTSVTATAVRRLRDAGLEHLIMVDAPDWGQDASNTMRDTAAQVMAADRLARTVFSVHMYGVFRAAGTVDAYLAAFERAGLPLVVGEFGHQFGSDRIDVDGILRIARQRRVGWLAWSWSGNGGGAEILDLTTNFDPRALTAWGRRVVDGTDGLRQTSREIPTAPGPTTPPTTPPTAPSGACAVRFTVQHSWTGGYVGLLTVTNRGRALNGWTLRFTLPAGHAITNLWNGRADRTTGTVIVTDAGYNAGLPTGGSTEIGYQAAAGEAPQAPTAPALLGTACTTG